MSISTPKPLGRYSSPTTIQVHESGGCVWWVQTYANRFVKWTLSVGPGTLTPIQDYSDADGIACAKYAPGAGSSSAPYTVLAQVHA